MVRRIVIIGGPHTGKTTLANRLGAELGIGNVMHSTDDLIGLGWSEASEAASKWFSDQGDWIIEGVSTARALRKWLRANPGRPLDADVVVVRDAFTPLLPGQRSMTTGVYTVFNEIEPELKRRGARIQKLKTANGAINLFRNEPQDTPEEASRHMQVEKSLGSDTLAYQGGAVKALGGGRVGGYLVLFSTAEDPDLQGEFFTKSTDLFIDSGDQRPILYRHGVHPVIKSRKLGRAKLTIDDIGVFVEGELELRDKYEKAIYALAEQGKLGWSSGSMSHLVSKNSNGKSFEITSWPIGEASLTPAPVEGRTVAIAVKDIVIDAEELDFDKIVKSVDQDQYDQHFSIDGIPSIKAFCEAVAPNSLKDGSQRSESAANAAKEFITITKLMGEAFHSYTSRLVRRSEHRFLKEGREIDASTVAQVESTLSDMERIQTAFDSIKEVLSGIKKISEMTSAEQRALDARTRLAVWELSYITGTTPEEFENGCSGS